MKELLMKYESVIMYLRGSLEKIGENFEYDFGTEDYLTSLLEYHEKTAWMLRSHLK
jgi:starvation-inducible DNA-binding protein